MAYHDVNRYGLGRGGRPSSHRYASPPMSSSRQATSGSSYLHNSPSGYRRTNSNMNAIQSPENGIYEEYGTTPMAISPYPEAGTIYHSFPGDGLTVANPDHRCYEYAPSSIHRTPENE